MRRRVRHFKLCQGPSGKWKLLISYFLKSFLSSDGMKSFFCTAPHLPLYQQSNWCFRNYGMNRRLLFRALNVELNRQYPHRPIVRKSSKLKLTLALCQLIMIFLRPCVLIGKAMGRKIRSLSSFLFSHFLLIIFKLFMVFPRVVFASTHLFSCLPTSWIQYFQSSKN